jgi:hypothetical protein
MPKEAVIKEVQLDDIINKFVFLAIILAVVLGAASAQTASTPSFRAQTVMTSGSPGSIRAGHILVRFKTTPAQGVLDQLNTAFGAKAVGKIAEIGVTHLQVPPQAGLALGTSHWEIPILLSPSSILGGGQLASRLGLQNRRPV